MIQFIKDCRKYLTRKEFKRNLFVVLLNVFLTIGGITAIFFGYYSGIWVLIAWIPSIPFFDSLENLVASRRVSEKMFVKDGFTWEDYKLTINS